MASNASRGGRDFRVAALFEALRASEQQGDAPADWGRFYEDGDLMAGYCCLASSSQLSKAKTDLLTFGFS